MLRPLGPLEDVTIALWLLPLQIHPTNDRRFTSKNVIAGKSLTVVSGEPRWPPVGPPPRRALAFPYRCTSWWVYNPG